MLQTPDCLGSSPLNSAEVAPVYQHLSCIGGEELDAVFEMWSVKCFYLLAMIIAPDNTT